MHDTPQGLYQASPFSQGVSQQASNARAHFDHRAGVDTLAGFEAAGGHSCSSSGSLSLVGAGHRRSGSAVSLDALLRDMTKDGISEGNQEYMLDMIVRRELTVPNTLAVVATSDRSTAFHIFTDLSWEPVAIRE